MKKFFPLCLLLVVALVWMVSIAGSDERAPTLNSEQITQKAPAIEKEKAVVETDVQEARRSLPVYQSQKVSEPASTITREKLLESTGELTPTLMSLEPAKSAIPTIRGEKAARVARDDTDKIPFLTAGPGERASSERMKEIKADGVISPDERSEYEELLSLAVPRAEIPMPLSQVPESEPNDSCHMADPVACGDTVWCASLAAGQDDEDWYTFTLSSAMQVRIETHPTGGDCMISSMTDTYLELWEAPCDSMIASNDDIDYPTNAFSRIVMDLSAGTYAILTDSRWSSGSYHLSLLCCDETPSNADCANAANLGGVYPIVDTGTTYCSSLDCPGLLDWRGVWYTFDLPYAENDIDIEMCPTGVNLWSVGPLLMPDCACTTFTFCDAYNFPLCASTGYVGFEMSFNAYPGPATVYWPAFAVDADDFGIEFEFTIDVSETPQDSIWNCYEEPPQYILPPDKLSGGNIDREPNDACSTAVEALCEYAYCGDIDTTTDDDWYYVDLPRDTTYGIHVRVFANDTPGQYAQGDSLDPRVYMLRSDCETLVASNDDYFGTFPDAENYDSQLDPGYPNCFLPGERVYIRVDRASGPGGPYLLIINCVPCEMPTGACCVQGECVATNFEYECEGLGGYWYAYETCPDFECPPDCDPAIYSNGEPDPWPGTYASQCITDFSMAAGVADDFVLPGTDPVDVGMVIAWFGHWNGPVMGPMDYSGLNITIYSNDVITLPYPAPGGKPTDGDPACTQMELIPGGIVYTAQLLPAEFSYLEDGPGSWRLMIPVNVTLTGGETYWLSVEPYMPFGTAGQSGWNNSELPDTTGNSARQIFEYLGTLVWTPLGVDMAFCMLPAPVWSCVDEPPLFLPPDNKRPGGNIDIEPNDACSTAVEALCENAYCGDIDTTTDDDWYYIDLPQDTTYGVHVRVFANDTPGQYAYGDSLDSRVLLFRSDCNNLTLVASNDDYFGTFPDAENYDSQLDPGYPNCFLPGERVYIRVDRASGPGGPYLLIINCVPCEMPTGACCIQGECIATNFEYECEGLGGYWYAYETCPDFECPPDCSPAIYSNGESDPWPAHYASQCITDFSWAAGTADDFVLPGTDPVDVGMVIAWFGHWNGPVMGPMDYSGLDVTIYSNDVITLPYPAPGGKPTDRDPDCTQMELIPGGIVYTTSLLPGEFSYVEDGPGSWRLMIPVNVTLTGGETYWLSMLPHMPFGTAGQSGWNNSELPDTTGNSARQIFEYVGTLVWTPLGVDMAFCMLELTGCDYVVGDVNGSGDYNGLDITYGVNYFKGGADPRCPLGSCPIPPCDAFFYCGDVNGSCNYNGLDITYGVNYFKGGAAPIPCPDCPPIGGPASDTGKPETPSVIKTKAVIQKGPSSE
ncbi:MAG: hypothetical protein JSU85_13335 [Candidatus Zixiibacteriota bacterium]|nr:MAG: hypothetical protein JSU85_13335 [candidate division Zixibacteria bacterium]